MQYLDNGEPMPTFIIIDIHMPQMNGFEFVDAFSKLQKAHHKFSAIHSLVMMSSSSDPEDEAKARSFSCVTDYRQKPIGMGPCTDLLSAIISS